MSELLIVNARVVDPSQQLDEVRPVAIKDGKFVEPEDLLNPVTLDLTGKVLAPGFMDAHVHLRDPGQTYKEDMETATAAAAAGGFTTVLAMPNTLPPADCPEVLEMVRQRARQVARVNVIQSACITKGREGKIPSDLKSLKQAGCLTVTDDGSTTQSTEVMRAIMTEAARLDLTVIDHCENTALSKPGVMHQGTVAKMLGLPGQPREAEISIVRRDLMLAEETGCRIHLQHLSCRESLELLREFKQRGVKATGEITPHHLLLTELDCMKYGTNAKMAPPVREEEDRIAMVEALCSGLVNIIATDHAPHTKEEKDRGWHKAPFGIIGIETAVAACYTELVETGRMNLMKFVELFTTGPNEILRTEKATLKSGHPADVTILDTQAKWQVKPENLHSKSLNCPWMGRTLTCKVAGVILGEKPNF